MLNSCLAGDFVARRVVDKYNIKPIIHSTAKLSVCSGLDNTCYDISDSVIISVNYLNERVNKINNFEIKAIIYDISKSVITSVNYFNERLNNTNTFEIKAIILDTSPLDLIIGL